MERLYGCDVNDVTHRFSVTLDNGKEKKLVDLHLNSGSFAAMCRAIHAAYSPSWTIDKFLLIWEDAI